MKKTVLSLFVVCCLAACNKTTTPSADYNVVPLPQAIEMTGGAGFELDGNTVIAYSGDEAMKRNAELLAGYVKESTGIELQIQESEASQSNAISLAIGNVGDNSEGYCLTVTDKAIEIAAPSPAGVFYGMPYIQVDRPSRLSPPDRAPVHQPSSRPP